MFLKQSTAYTFRLGPFVDSTDGNTEENALTIAAASVLLSKAGGTLTAKNDATALTGTGVNAHYTCVIDGTDTNTLGSLRVWAHITGALPVYMDFMVVSANVYDSLVAASDNLQVDTTQIAGVAVSTTTAQIGANVVQVSADATAADNLEAMLDGTGGVTLTTNLGGNVTGSIGSLAAQAKADVNAEVDAALADVNLDHLIGTATGIPAVPAGTYLDQMMDDGTAVFDRTTDSFQAIRDNMGTPQTGDSFARLGAPAGASIAADLVVIDNFVDGLEATIGSAGAGLTAVPWNASWDAEVQSEVEDALVVHRLDELLNADSDIDGVAPPTVGSVFHELLTKTAGSFTYDQTTDSLEAIRDKETDIETDTAEIGIAGAGLTNINLPNQTMDIVGNITGNLSGSVGSVTGAVGSVTSSVGSIATGGIATTSFAAGAVNAAALNADAVAEIADGIWDEAIAGHLGAGSTGEKLNAAASAGDPWTTAVPGAYGAGTAGNILGTNLNATVSSRSTYAGGAVASVTGDVSGNLAGKVLGGGAGTITGTGVRAVDASGNNVAPASTALTNATWTDVRAVKLDNADVATSTRSSHSAADVWASATRTLTSFGTLAADVWASSTRTLTSLGTSLVQEVWDRATSALITVGSIGKLLVDQLNATISSRASQASLDTHESSRATMQTTLVTEHDATQSELASATYGLSALNTDLDSLLSRLTATRAGYLDNLSAGAVGLEATLTAMKGAGWTNETLAAIKVLVDDLETRLTATRAGLLDNLDATISGVPAAVGGRIVETQGSYTLDQAFRIILAVLAGVTTTGGSVFKTPNGVSTRVTATVNASDERTAMTLTP